MARPPTRPGLIAGLLLATLFAAPAPSRAQTVPDAGAQPDALTAVGQDLTLQYPNIHLSRTPDGLLHARLFLAPLYTPGSAGWRVRDTTLQLQADGSLAPASVPFGLHLAARAGAPSLASLTNEDKVGMQIAVARSASIQTLSGAPTSAPTTPLLDIPGQAAADTITYPSALAGGADLAVAATREGAAVQLTVPDAQAAGLSLTLSLDHQVSFGQSTSGAVVIRRAIPACGSTGCAEPVQQPEYVLEAPLVTGSDGAPIAGAPARLQIIRSGGSDAQVVVSLDPTWLAVPGRTFPLRVRVPVDTAASVIRPSLAGSVSSCAPAAPAVLGDLVVGTSGSCAINGILRFDLSAPILQHPILAASLHLYAPGQAGPVGVKTYSGAPPAKEAFPAPAPIVSAPLPATTGPTGIVPLTDTVTPAQVQANLPKLDLSQFPAVTPMAFPVLPAPAYEPPTWNSAAIAPGAQGVAAAQGSGSWQAWDVMGIVQPWISQGYAANGGLVLASDGAPVRFATQRGTAAVAPALAPYLDLTFAGTAQAQASARSSGGSSLRPQIQDAGSTSMFGLAQSNFVPDKTCVIAAIVDTNACSGPQASQSGGRPNTVYGPEYSFARDRNLSYVRSGPVNIKCGNYTLWRNSQYWQAAYDFMRNAYADNLIPIVVFIFDPKCNYNITGNDPNADIAVAMANFASLVPTFSSARFGSDPPMYFEIGNEPNNVFTNPGHTINPRAALNWLNYPTLFSQAAVALGGYLATPVSGGHGAYHHFRVLTGGVVGPAPYTTCSLNGSGTHQQLTLLRSAIYAAQNGFIDPWFPVPLPGLDTSHLGVASHPYGYAGLTPQGLPYSFPNFYSQGGIYPGSCQDISNLTDGWTYLTFPNIVHVATEDNYSSLPSAPYPPFQNATNLEGSYLMDLATWMWWYLGESSELQYPFEVMWFSGLDSPASWTNGPGSQPTAGDALLGLLDFFLQGNSIYGTDNKAITFAPSCPGLPQIGTGSHLPTIMAAVAPGGAHC